MQETKRRGRLRGLVGLNRGRPSKGGPVGGTGVALGNPVGGPIGSPARANLPDVRGDLRGDARGRAEIVEYRVGVPGRPARTPAGLPARLFERARAPLRWIGLTTQPSDPAHILRDIGRNFALFVLVPTAVVALYLFGFASDQYVSEARFAVRGMVESATSVASMGPLASVAGHNSNQEGAILTDYVESPSVIAAINREIDIAHAFSRDEADFWARFDPKLPIEELVKYWRKHVAVRADPLSGIITLEVRAFTPGDAQAIGQAIVKRAEALVNEISRRAQTDAVERNREEVDKAGERLRRAHLALQEYRNRWGIIDPAKSAEATTQTLIQLERERLKTENDLRVLRDTLDEKSRSVQTLVATLAALNDQIKHIKDELTNNDVKPLAAPNATQAILEYEGLMIERIIAEKIYESAQQMFDRSRVTAQRQLIYLVSFVEPTLPEASIYPLRGSSVLIAFFCFLVVWSIASLVVAGVKDHHI